MIKKAYEKYVLPKMLDACCSTKPINYQRNKIVPIASGTVLEIGIGSGLNIPYYQKQDIQKIYGLDPSEELCEMAKKIARGCDCLLYTSPSPRDATLSRMPSSA